MKELKVSSKEEVKKLYEDTAESYAKMMDSEIESPVYKNTLSRLSQRIADISGPLLDTSCGTGHMLELYNKSYDPQRDLIGIDLSSNMIALASDKLGNKAKLHIGDMSKLKMIPSVSVAAAISFFAIHHLDPYKVVNALEEWNRVLQKKGQLLLATWEGTGSIDYGDETDVVALRFKKSEIESWVTEAGFTIDRCIIEPVEEIPMDAIYLEASKN